VTDTRTLRAPSDAIMAREDQQNAGGVRHVQRDTGFAYYDQAPLSEYPRMMYRKTEVEQVQDSAATIEGLKDEPTVINRYEGLLCETTIAHDADEAEVLSTNGWDVSPKAAHGVEDGLIKATSAKDAEIAELRALLAAQSGAPASEEAPRRGPGRPPKDTAGQII